MRQRCVPVIILLWIATLAAAQGGGGLTLFGDIKVDESATSDLRPMSFQVLLYSESGNLLLRETVPSNGRYRFLNLRPGRYEIVVELENLEIARVSVNLSSPFKADFRKDIELQWLDRNRRKKAQVISALDNYNRSKSQAAQFSKALEASNKKHYEKAIALLREIVVNDPKDFPAWTELGTAYFITKDFVESERAYLEALKLQPEYAVALISLGRLRIAEKKFDGAVEVLTNAVKAAPESAQANYFLGEAYLQLKLGSKAIGYLYEAIRLDPIGMADAHLRLAALYNAKQLKDKAVAEYEAFLKQRPDYPDRKKIEAYIEANKRK